jgi:hypothetical protein
MGRLPMLEDDGITLAMRYTEYHGTTGPNASGFKAKRMRAASDVGCTV